MHPKNDLQSRRTSTHTPADAKAPGPVLIGYGELCLMLGISRRHAQRMVHRGELPQPRLAGNRRLFVVAEVLRAIEKLPTP
jgi:excisionase family DNA binding protein